LVKHLESKTLVIAYSESQALRLIPVVKKMAKDHGCVVVVALDHNAQKKFEQNGIMPKSSRDYLTAEAYDNIDKAAFSFAKKWYNLTNLTELVTYSGISLGSLAEYDLSLFLVGLIKDVESTKTAIETEKPTRIVAVHDNNSAKNVSIVIANLQKIPIQYLKSSKISQFKYRILKNAVPISFRLAGLPLKLEIPRLIFRFLISTTNHLEKLIIKIQLIKQPKKKDSTAYRNKILMLNFKITDYCSLIKALKNDDKNGILIINSLKPLAWDNGAIKALTTMDLQYRLLTDYSTKEIKNKISEAKKWLANSWHILKDSESFKKTFTYQEIPLWNLLEDEFFYLFSTYFEDLIKYVEVMKFMINHEKVNIVVSWNDVLKFEKTVALVCRDLKIPTIVIQHGVTGHHIGYVPVTSDKMAVWGDIAKNWFINYGVDPDKLVITGNPRFDSLSQKQVDGKKYAVYHDLKLDSNKGFFVYATQPISAGFISRETEKVNELAFRALLKAMEEFPNKQLVIKLHPIDDGKLIRRIVGEQKAKMDIAVTKNVNLYNLLRLTDLLIAIDSTVALEAMLLNKPVVLINLDKRSNIYLESGAAIGVEEPQNIAPTIKEVLFGTAEKALEKERKKFVYDYAFKQDGQASKRISDLIEQMVNRSE
jgi:hypothetical protein